MKKVFLLAVFLVGLALIIVAADYRSIPKIIRPSPIIKPCVGYTIIEFSRGIDCHGDTVRLRRQHGFAELAVGNR